MQLYSEFRVRTFHIRVNWLVAVCVLITCAAFMRLSLWQLDRAAEKVEAQQALELDSRTNAQPLEDIPAGHLHPSNAELVNRHVSLAGEFDNERTILLLGEFFDGQIGYGVVTPFRLDSNNHLVLVHRGWTTGVLPVNTRPELRPYEGPVELTAQIYLPPKTARIDPSQIDPSTWPLRIRRLDFDAITEVLEEPVFPFEVRLTAQQPGGLVRHWPAVHYDVNQNLSYAVQWFGLALLVLFASVLASSNLWSLIKAPESE
jgi:surfeit locus 1 family protein